jgi:hypothetical protein
MKERKKDVTKRIQGKKSLHDTLSRASLTMDEGGVALSPSVSRFIPKSNGVTDNITFETFL